MATPRKVARNADSERKKVVLLLALAAGSSKHAAASKAGVPYRSFARWQADDELFAEAVEVAQGQGRDVYEALIREHAEKDWRAAYALLEANYLDQARGKARLSEDVPPLPTKPPSELFGGETPEEARQRVVKVLALLRTQLGSDEAVEEIIAANSRRP